MGGSSRIPLVSQLVTAELGRPVAVDAHPKHAVALGAALLAGRAGAAGPATAAPVAILTPPAVVEAAAPPPPAPPAAEPEPDAEPSRRCGQSRRSPASVPIPTWSRRPSPSRSAPAPPQRRGRIGLWVGLAALVLVAVVAGVLLTAGGDGDDDDGGEESSDTTVVSSIDPEQPADGVTERGVARRPVGRGRRARRRRRRVRRGPRRRHLRVRPARRRVPGERPVQGYEGFDTVLQIFDEEGSLVDEQDDPEEGVHDPILTVDIPDGETWSATVLGYDGLAGLLRHRGDGGRVAIVRERVDHQELGMHEEDEPLVVPSEVLLHEEPLVEVELGDPLPGHRACRPRRSGTSRRGRRRRT